MFTRCHEQLRNSDEINTPMNVGQKNVRQKNLKPMERFYLSVLNFSVHEKELLFREFRPGVAPISIRHEV